MKLNGFALTALAFFLLTWKVMAMSDLLLIETDPASSGMAGAGVGLPQNAGGYNINPAGQSASGKIETGLDYSQWFGGVSLACLHASLPLGSKTSLGVNLLYRGLTFRETDGAGTPLDKNIGFKSYIENLDLSFELFRDLRLGLGCKIIQDFLQDHAAQFQGFDYGILYQWKFLSAGFSVLNNPMGGKVVYQSQEEIITKTLRAGLGASLLENRLRLAMDLLGGDDIGLRFKTGAEYVLKNIFFLRVGYFGYDFTHFDPIAGLCAGFGIQWQSISLDYSWFNGGNLNGANSLIGIKGISRVGVKYAF